MNSLQDSITAISNRFKTEINQCKDLTTLENLRITFMGRKGEIAQLMPLLATLNQDEKRVFGPLLNELKTFIETSINSCKKSLELAAFKEKEEAYKFFDVTAYNVTPSTGSLHLYTQATELIEDIFISMGYQVMDGNEVESEFYNFEALNIPKNHPARDMQDTFFLEMPETVLRTHTSSVQIKTLQNQKPPLAIITTGRVFRNEATDASHDFMFRQFEGLVVDKDISLAHLLATMKTFLQKFFDKKDLAVRARPGYFPFVEPGLEIDMSCPFCKTGCSTCKKTTWIEIVGSGLVHPQVFAHCNVDANIYTGFAFGFGLTRLIMLKHGISDIRLLHSSNIDFLMQFKA